MLRTSRCAHIFMLVAEQESKQLGCLCLHATSWGPGLAQAAGSWVDQHTKCRACTEAGFGCGCARASTKRAAGSRGWEQHAHYTAQSQTLLACGTKIGCTEPAAATMSGASVANSAWLSRLLCMRRSSAMTPARAVTQSAMKQAWHLVVMRLQRWQQALAS